MLRRFTLFKAVLDFQFTLVVSFLLPSPTGSLFLLTYMMGANIVT